MFEKITPEAAGISSAQVQKFLHRYQEYNLGVHSVVLAKGDQIFAEAYWAPFHKDFFHRQYSETKSFVATAICQLAAEGKLSLDDKIVDYFQDMLPEKVHPYLQAMTIRHMLQMQTCMSTFPYTTITDRVKRYFHNEPTHYPGTTFLYDSNGSFILSVLVERVSGQHFLEYLRGVCLDEIGFSKDAYCLDWQGDYPWGDSGLICTQRDILRFVRLLARGGKYQGKQLLAPGVAEEVTRRRVDNSCYYVNSLENAGYGYQVWQLPEGAFTFKGMHGQYAMYHPGLDLTMVCNGGVLDINLMYEVMLYNYYENIVKVMGKEALPENPAALKELEEYISGLKLVTVAGAASSPWEETINGKRYVTDGTNPMGIREFTLYFDEKGGRFAYVNDQGAKELIFGRKENFFQKFPQTGYSKHIGSEGCEGHVYGCGVSAAWSEEKKLRIFAQILDEYFGLLDITISFNDNYAVIEMKKNAEFFLSEYEGYGNFVPETGVKEN